MGVNKKLNHEDIRQYVADDLLATTKSEKAELKKLKFQHSVSTVENSAGITAKRRNIARLLTEANRRKKENKA